MKSSFSKRDLISITDYCKSDIEKVLKTAHNLHNHPNPNLLKGDILATCFFEPSTRTRLSFETAMHKLGGSVIGFSEKAITSTEKGESLTDTMKVIGSYADIIVIRHPLEGSARLAAAATDKPVINAGDGANQHPTQTLLDLFTIEQCQGKIDNLHIALVGDLKYSRTIHSLSLALSHYPVRLYFLSPIGLSLPEEICHELKKKGVKFSFHSSFEEIMPKIDILYMSRIQKERLPSSNIDLINPCLLKLDDLQKAKPNLRILHALPRVDEIDKKIDTTPHAYYFQQAANGVIVRMAILSLLLGKS